MMHSTELAKLLLATTTTDEDLMRDALQELEIATLPTDYDDYGPHRVYRIRDQFIVIPVGPEADRRWSYQADIVWSNGTKGAFWAFNRICKGVPSNIKFGGWPCWPR